MVQAGIQLLGQMGVQINSPAPWFVEKLSTPQNLATQRISPVRSHISGKEAH